jgi:hypothetical protein
MVGVATPTRVGLQIADLRYPRGVLLLAGLPFVACGEARSHCKGGLGRAGMMAARLLVELGVAPEQAIRDVRCARPGAIETPAQLALVRRTVAIS